jgi:hypothetical protein
VHPDTHPTTDRQPTDGRGMSMTKFTVTLTKALIAYDKAEVEVEAEDETVAHAIAQAMDSARKLKWPHDPTLFADGYVDVEVTNPHGGSVSWREE